MKDKKAFVTTYLPVAGWKAVLMTWDDECGMHTPWQTSYFAYKTKAEAVAYGKVWAADEGVAFKETA
jgi:hypothetical protein